MRMVTWLMTMATADTIEYRMNLWIEPVAAGREEDSLDDRDCQCTARTRGARLKRSYK